MSLGTFITRARARGKLGDLSIQDLESVWENQKGLCPYSGVSLQMPSYRQKNNLIYTASLDRIESHLPYSRDNVQFVSAAINHMKGELSHEQTIELCRMIAKHWQ